mmetsp:Transcript_34830/g.115412  ORF Transcript_34830/g.115412 Transcript_34830/m.115412 type:complete len:205 (-) Transcript_34830:1212-1826(-)
MRGVPPALVPEHRVVPAEVRALLHRVLRRLLQVRDRLLPVSAAAAALDGGLWDAAVALHAAVRRPRRRRHPRPLPPLPVRRVGRGCALVGDRQTRHLLRRPMGHLPHQLVERMAAHLPLFRIAHHLPRGCEEAALLRLHDHAVVRSHRLANAHDRRRVSHPRHRLLRVHDGTGRRSVQLSKQRSSQWRRRHRQHQQRRRSSEHA